MQYFLCSRVHEAVKYADNNTRSRVMLSFGLRENISDVSRELEYNDEIGAYVFIHWHS